MTAIIILSALVILGMLWFFRWRLHRGKAIRKRSDRALGITCAVAVEQAQAQRKSLSAQMTRAELASRKAAEKSRDPDTAGHGRISVIIAVALFAGSLFALLARTQSTIGGDPSLAHASQTVEGNTAPPNTRGSNPRQSFDERLAELRARPSLATVSAIDRSPPIPERRAEVLAALKPLLENESKSIRLVTARAIQRWNP